MMRFLIISTFVLLCACGVKKDPVSVASGKIFALNDSILAGGVADTVDFKRVHEGEELVQNVTFRNDSPKPLVILSVEISCGCVEVDYPRKPIAPGETAQAKVYFHSGGLSGFQYKPIGFRTSLGPQRYRFIVMAEVI